MNVYYYNVETAEWVIVPNPAIDAEANTISVTVNHFTVFMLAEPEPEPEPVSEPAPEPQNTGGGPWIGGGGGSGGGGGTARLGMEIEENCAGKEIVVTVLNPSDNPAENATITVYTLAWKTVEEQKSDEEGKAIFVLEAGEYTVRATKSGYMVNTKQITVEECAAEMAEEVPEEGAEVLETAQETPLEISKQATEQEMQNLGEAEEQETQNRTGFFSLEGNGERATTAAMAGVFVAVIIGAALYVREKVKKK